jgi:hypothetical protein
MKAVLADTFYFLALLDSLEAFHCTAAETIRLFAIRERAAPSPHL